MNNVSNTTDSLLMEAAQELDIPVVLNGIERIKSFIDYERPFFGILNYFSSLFYIAVLIAIHTSRDKSHHTTFFTIYKVTAIYGMINLLTSYTFDICLQSPWVYKAIEWTNTTGSFCFVTGCLFIEIQRFLVLGRANFDENYSSRRLCIVFILQFLVFFSLQFPLIPSGVEYDGKGCINGMSRDYMKVLNSSIPYEAQHDNHHYFSVLRSFVAFFYCFYVVSSAILTAKTLRKMKTTRRLKKSEFSLHLSLVRYSIYCSLAQMSKGIVQMVGSVALFAQNDEIKGVYKVLYYPINFVAINSTLVLLLYFSRSVKRRVLRVYCCKPTISIKVYVASKTDESNTKKSLENVSTRNNVLFALRGDRTKQGIP